MNNNKKNFLFLTIIKIKIIKFFNSFESKKQNFIIVKNLI